MSTPEKKRSAKKPALPAVASKPGTLAAEIRQLIEVARRRVAHAVNAGLTLLHWQIGSRIHPEILGEKRADYGAEIVSTLSRQLVPEFGRGFGTRNLFRMVRFAGVFPDRRIVSALMTQLRWTHFIYLIALKNDLMRDFYAEMCDVERWSVLTLQQKIGGMLAAASNISFELLKT